MPENESEFERETKPCPLCGEEILAVAKRCRYCGSYLDGRGTGFGRDASMVDRMLLPVGRPISSIAAGYLALFGIVPLLGLPFSISAVVCGITALKAIRRDPKLSGAGRAWFGIIVGSLMTLLSVFMIVILVFFAPRRR
jgi:hypothetical protein